MILEIGATLVQGAQSSMLALYSIYTHFAATALAATALAATALAATALAATAQSWRGDCHLVESPDGSCSMLVGIG
jgi:invasion protein IalB